MKRWLIFITILFNIKMIYGQIVFEKSECALSIKPEIQLYKDGHILCDIYFYLEDNYYKTSIFNIEPNHE